MPEINEYLINQNRELMEQVEQLTKTVNHLNATIDVLRACLESARVRIAPASFSPDEAKTAGNTLCINEDFGKIWRKTQSIFD